jgi:hypothetical protein
MASLFNRRGINIDITHRCPLECKRCQRFTSFTSKGLKVPGEDLSVDETAEEVFYALIFDYALSKAPKYKDGNIKVININSKIIIDYFKVIYNY